MSRCAAITISGSVKSTELFLSASILWIVISSPSKPSLWIRSERLLQQSLLWVVANTWTSNFFAIFQISFYISDIVEKCKPVSISSTSNTPPWAETRAIANAKIRHIPSPILPMGMGCFWSETLTLNPPLAPTILVFKILLLEPYFSGPIEAIRSILGSIICSASRANVSSGVKTI